MPDEQKGHSRAREAAREISSVADPDYAALNTSTEDVMAMAFALNDLFEQFEALRDREADLVDAIKDLLGTPMAGGYEQRDATAAVRSKAARLLAVSNPAMTPES